MYSDRYERYGCGRIKPRNTPTTAATTKTARPRGFAAMDPETQRAIASKGGRAAHEKGTAHEWDPQEARIAGRRGGANSHGGGRPKKI